MASRLKLASTCLFYSKSVKIDSFIAPQMCTSWFCFTVAWGESRLLPSMYYVMCMMTFCWMYLNLVMLHSLLVFLIWCWPGAKQVHQQLQWDQSSYRCQQGRWPAEYCQATHRNCKCCKEVNLMLCKMYAIENYIFWACLIF